MFAALGNEASKRNVVNIMIKHHNVLGLGMMNLVQQLQDQFPVCLSSLPFLELPVVGLS